MMPVDYFPLKWTKKYGFESGNLTFELKHTSFFSPFCSIPSPFRYLLCNFFLLCSESFYQGIIWWKANPGFSNRKQPKSTRGLVTNGPTASAVRLMCTHSKQKRRPSQSFLNRREVVGAAFWTSAAAVDPLSLGQPFPSETSSSVLLSAACLGFCSSSFKTHWKEKSERCGERNRSGWSLQVLPSAVKLNPSLLSTLFFSHPYIRLAFCAISLLNFREETPLCFAKFGAWSHAPFKLPCTHLFKEDCTLQRTHEASFVTSTHSHTTSGCKSSSCF